MNIPFGVMGGLIFAELPTWEMVSLKSGTESEFPEYLIRSVSSPQYDSGNFQTKLQQNLFDFAERVGKGRFGIEIEDGGVQDSPIQGKLP